MPRRKCIFGLWDFDDDEDRIRREKAWDEWAEREFELIRKAAKCANWVSDMVRKTVNPYFRLREGYVLTPEHDLGGTRTLYKYTDEEIAQALADPAHSLGRAKRPYEEAGY